jgi:hypothetical protein
MAKGLTRIWSEWDRVVLFLLVERLFYNFVDALAAIGLVK